MRPEIVQAAAPKTFHWRSRLTVIAILMLAGLSIVLLSLYLRHLHRAIDARLAHIREQFASAEAQPYIQEGTAGIRRFLEERGHVAFFSAPTVRSYNLSLLAHAYQDELGPEDAPARRAWLILLLSIHAPQSRPFFETVAPGLRDPELKGEVEKCLKSLP